MNTPFCCILYKSVSDTAILENPFCVPNLRPTKRRDMSKTAVGDKFYKERERSNNFYFYTEIIMWLKQTRKLKNFKATI